MLISLLLSFLIAIHCVPEKAPDAPDLFDADTDFGVPKHDNTVKTELDMNSTYIHKLIARDYFTDSIMECDNETAPGNYMVYCSGRLLQAVMSVRLYPDSKTFVDQPIKRNFSGIDVITEFNERFPGPIEKLNKADIQKFVDEFFDKEGNELDLCELPDWVPNPSKLDSINDKNYKEFAQRLHFIWIHLCRKMKEEVGDEPDRFSLIYLPHNFIIPGGRFREFYYWDAYWIIKGLLASQLYSTARGMLLNFAHIIDTRGYIPNGGRVYYLRRSQPPMFAPMVYEYYLATKDSQLVSDTIHAIEKEFHFWTERRQVNFTIEDGEQPESFSMFQYRTEANTPRPESFREDVISARHFNTSNEKRRFFRDIASAAESGWDFSSRWFKDGTNISTIETTNVVPVDLNAFICYNMNILAFFYSELGDLVKHNQWFSNYKMFREQFTKVFYVPSQRGWYDYNLRTKMHNTNFFPTIAVPLFAQCYDPLNFRLAVDVYNQMKETGAFGYEGGIPTSLHKVTREQWDFPNGWSPLNHMVIEGLRKSISPMMQQKAFSLAEKWLITNIKTFNVSGAMWEKYNVEEPEAKLAAGGEYDVQAGFGWTNGVALDLMLTYGDRLKYTDSELWQDSKTTKTDDDADSNRVEIIVPVNNASNNDSTFDRVNNSINNNAINNNQDNVSLNSAGGLTIYFASLITVLLLF